MVRYVHYSSKKLSVLRLFLHDCILLILELEAQPRMLEQYRRVEWKIEWYKVMKAFMFKTDLALCKRNMAFDNFFANIINLITKSTLANDHILY